MATSPLHAFIDEAGQRSRSARSSHHFVMSAVVVPDEHLSGAADLVARLRSDLGRQPGDTLHWRNFKHHSLKLHMSKSIGAANYLRLCSVVVCKRHLADVDMDEDQAYLYTLRYLLERLSWLARDQGREVRYTLAHVVRFKTATLREYEAVLRSTPEPACQIAWQFLDPRGGRLDQPNRVDSLQLADAVASATFAAFEPDQFGNTEQRYLRELLPQIWRRGSGPNALVSYGLKVHPWAETTKAAYPWVAAL